MVQAYQNKVGTPIAKWRSTITVTTDASEAMWGGYITKDNNLISKTQGVWSPEQAQKTSNWPELKGISNCLVAFSDLIPPRATVR